MWGCAARAIDIAQFNCCSAMAIVGILTLKKTEDRKQKTEGRRQKTEDSEYWIRRFCGNDVERSEQMNIRKQIDYWKTSSDEDFAAAESLLEKGHLRHCLFFAHLAVEKMLKAYVTRQTNDIPPRIHNLIRLAEIAKLKLDSERVEFLREFGIYQLEGRYPDFEQVPVDSGLAREEISRAKEMLIWLKTQL